MSKTTNRRVWNRTSQAVSTYTTVPAGAAATGTITTVGKNYTTSAANQVEAGDWIFHAGSGQVRRIVHVYSTTTGLLDAAFGSDLTTQAYTVIDGHYLATIWAVDIKVTGATTVIDGLTFTQNDAIRIGTPLGAEASFANQLRPIVIDGSGSKTANAIIHHVTG